MGPGHAMGAFRGPGGRRGAGRCRGQEIKSRLSGPDICSTRALDTCHFDLAQESNGAVVSPTAHTAPLPGFPAHPAPPVGATDLLTHSESSGTGGSSRGSRRTACLRTPPETSAGRPVCGFPDAAADEDLAYVHRNGHRRDKLQPEDLMAARGAISREDLMRGPPCGRCVGLGLRGGPRARTAGFDSFR